jgi:alkylated DNA repair dioxygenase AlkB
MKNDAYQNIGLYTQDSFISDEDHDKLIENIEKELVKYTSSGYMDRNKVLRYGDKSMCENNHISDEIPPFLDAVCDKLVSNNILIYKPDTININEYLKGDFISPHIDRLASGPIVTILSLKSTSKMIFSNGKENFELILLPKMLIQMKNEIRWQWRHSILPVEDTRYSIVFRNKS